MPNTVRVGIVGAGNNTRKKHIPGFRSVDGVELAGVVNRSPESTGRVAEEFDIPQGFSDWKQLVEDDEIDAVLIGTWPDMHCEITCAALAAGKHVLCEARMARKLDEALRMLQAARERPQLVTQVVPSPFGLVQHRFVQGLIADGFLGELRELVVIGANAQFRDRAAPLHWRQQQEISGRNTLAMGILHETAMRWAPSTKSVLAQSAVFETHRPASPVTGNTKADVPDSVQIVTRLEGGACGLYHLSGIAAHGPGMHIHMYGSEGTVKLDCLGDRLFIGRAGDDGLREAEIPEEKRGGWRVEAEFIEAIRGESRVQFTTFADGLKYMEFTEAVARSAQTNEPVTLPLSS